MSLTPGLRLGPYEIVAALGAGGMGEVYRAKDTRLGRPVAIKVLPPDLAADAPARARLQQEAKAISTLGHPNVCALFDIGEYVPPGPAPEGQAPAPLLYLVMEYLEGTTLSDRLSLGPLPVDDARRLAVQIASALAKAHERGIVHRDLKPGNIMLVKSGADRPGESQAKLLDFGLAKSKPPVSGAMSHSAVTTQSALTVEGTIVGTLSYMSPEQMEGRSVDGRSDLFSFGAVLYEAVTGRRAFGGDNPASVIAAVLRSHPAPPRSLRGEIPADLERVIVVCLAKDPAERWQSALDVALHLGSPERSAPAPAPSALGRRRWVAPALFACGAALGLAAGWGLRPGARVVEPPQLVQLSIPLGTGSSLLAPESPRAGSSIAVSRDGRRLVYVSRQNGGAVLVLRAIDRTEETVLRGTDGGFGPFFSPDGNWVAFFTESALKKVPVDGGGPVTVCPTPPVSRGGTWADDDTIYFTPDFTSGVQRVAASGGRPQNATTLDLAAKESNHLFPEALPGGELLLFTAWKGGTFEAASTWVFSTHTGRRTLLVDGASQARYLPQGYVVFTRAGALLAAPFDVKSLTLLGAPTPVVEGVWNDPSTGTAHYAVSHTGTLVRAPGQHTVASRRLAWVDRRGRVEFLPCEPGLYTEPKLSPDGRRLAFELLNDIWVYDFQNRTMTRATFRGVNQAPVWTPDGRRLAFSSSQDVTRPALYWVDPSGGEDPEILSREGEVQFPSSWSPDGSTLAFAEIEQSDPGGDFDIWLLTGGGPWKRQRLIHTPFNDDQLVFSPDGRALAWVSTDTGRPQVYVRALPGSGRTLVSPDGGFEPIWARSGRELFYRNGKGFYAAPVSTAGSLTVGRPTLLFERELERGSLTPGIPEYDVAPDGQRFLVVTAAADSGSASRLDVALNWVEELKRRVPRQPTK